MISLVSGSLPERTRVQRLFQVAMNLDWLDVGGEVAVTLSPACSGNKLPSQNPFLAQLGELGACTLHDLAWDHMVYWPITVHQLQLDHDDPWRIILPKHKI